MDRVNYVTYGTGYCDICLSDKYLVFIGDSEPKGICTSCLPRVIEQMQDVASLLKFLKEKQLGGD